MSYKQYKNYDDSVNSENIIRIADGVCIPFDEGNRDYQEYLEWLEEGNTPEAPDD